MQLGEVTDGAIATVNEETPNPGAAPAQEETINPNTASAYQKGQLYNIPIIDFLNDPNQPRKVFDTDALEELAASIQKHGILEPVLFQPGREGYVNVVAGERRIAAARKAGITMIPAVCVEGNASEIAPVENLLRQDLTAVEEAEALKRLMDEQKYTQDQLAVIIGKARTTISDALQINRLPVDIRNECRGDRVITKSTLIAISRKKQERGMVTAYNAYREKLQKVRGPRKKTETDANAYQPVSDLIDKTTSRLGVLDTTTWEEAEKNSLHDALLGLRNAIDSYLEPPSPQ